MTKNDKYKYNDQSPEDSMRNIKKIMTLDFFVSSDLHLFMFEK